MNGDFGFGVWIAISLATPLSRVQVIGTKIDKGKIHTLIALKEF